MGRVYEALKRAAEKEASGAAVVTPSNGTNGNGQSRPHDGGRSFGTEDVTALAPELPERLLLRDVLQLASRIARGITNSIFFITKFMLTPTIIMPYSFYLRLFKEK
jgi:hypothetical protein